MCATRKRDSRARHRTRHPQHNGSTAKKLANGDPGLREGSETHTHATAVQVGALGGKLLQLWCGTHAAMVSGRRCGCRASAELSWRRVFCLS